MCSKKRIMNSKIGIRECRENNGWDLRIACIFLKKVSKFEDALALRDTCLLKLMEDPQNVIDAAKKLQIQGVYNKISMGHHVQAHSEYQDEANKIYERCVSKKNTLKVSSATLPIGLSYAQNTWRIKFQSENVIYKDSIIAKDDTITYSFTEALIARDALLKTLRANNALLPTAGGELARPDLDIPKEYLQFARDIYERAHKKTSSNILEKQPVGDLTNDTISNIISNIISNTTDDTISLDGIIQSPSPPLVTSEVTSEVTHKRLRISYG